MAEYDLTHRLMPFLDIHLVIPLLEFIEPRKIYDENSLAEMQRQVVLKTNMIDSAIETYPEDNVPTELLQRRDDVLRERDQLKAECDPVIAILELEDVKEMMESARDREGNSKLLEYIEKEYSFKPEMLEILYRYAKFQYECGNYAAASICLYYYRNVVPQGDPNYLNALYGKLASEILCQEFAHAKDDLIRLRAYIDSDPFDGELELLQHRSWLLHWSLFIFFNLAKGRDDLIDLFLNQQAYLNTIQILCPHLLRYVSVSVVISKAKQKNSLKELMRVIDVERKNYSDPVTEFLSCLYLDYDFDAAQQKLRECEDVLANDFFLTALLDEFRENARLLIFEMFCRIHQCIGLDMLANRLNMDKTEAERWIVDLIRNYHIEGAKIDSQLGQVIMSAKPISIHEQIMENTKRLTFRAQQAALQLEKLKLDKKGSTNYASTS
jgi:translation initiation factor 3 subunit E|uniref:Eukaryotic translation initiation factor 3 subunit E n=1 Tax=Panagrolaimus sp. PS1159 TaxID=55785 RepID=A0AC35F6K1_9BILA